MADQAEALTDAIPSKRLHIAPEQPHRPTMVAHNMIGHPEEVTRGDLQGAIAEGLSHGEGVLARRDRTIMVPHLPQISAHMSGGPPQPRLVVEGLGEGGRLAEVVEHLPEFAEFRERTPQVEPEVDGLLLRGTALREMPEGGKGLLGPPHDLAEGRTRQRLGPGLPTVCHG